MKIVKQEKVKNYVERDNWYAVQLADMALKYQGEFDDLEDEMKAIRDLYDAAVSMAIKDEFEIACHFLGVPLLGIQPSPCSYPITE